MCGACAADGGGPLWATTTARQSERHGRRQPILSGTERRQREDKRRQREGREARREAATPPAFHKLPDVDVLFDAARLECLLQELEVALDVVLSRDLPPHTMQG